MAHEEREKECLVPCKLVRETHDALLELRGDLETKVETLWADMYNGGEKGVKTQLTVLIASLSQEKITQQKNDDEREKRQERRDRRMNFILAALTLVVLSLGLLFAIPPAVAAMKAVFNGEINLPKIIFSEHVIQVYAFSLEHPKDAVNSIAFTAQVR